MTTPGPPPEALLIARLREDAVPPLSMREAARRAGISPSLWAQNETGRRKVTAGVTIPIRATAGKLAVMALVVGATPGQLREAAAGQDPGDEQRVESAARMLQRLIDAGPSPRAQMAEVIRGSRDFTDAQKRELLRLLREDE